MNAHASGAASRDGSQASGGLRPHGRTSRLGANRPNANFSNRKSSGRRNLRSGLVAALPRRDRLGLIAIAFLWLAFTVFFWSWWLSPTHVETLAGLLVNSVVLGFDLVLVPVWFFFFLLRMRRPASALEVPELRTAMVVTKAPSEPWPLVRTTLEAMLRQDFPHPYDVWLADEKLTDEVIDWCAAHGVHMSSREGVAEYHNTTWPRRTKCKEGNLAFFYDNWGYRDYDVVAQLDADHVPEADYLRRMVAPFSNSRVGYVAAPSICDRNADSSWSARGRLYAEAVLHGSTQSGANAGYAPSCIGSHYAVRTAALEGAGGLGPELAEDFSTTLILSSNGWEGVFAIDAEAHGDGPDSITDCVTQDFQWARSMIRVLLTVVPKYWKGLSRRAKIKLGGCLAWYPLHTLVMLTMVLLPAWALIEHAPLVPVNVGDFYLHFLPVGLVLLLAVLWVRSARAAPAGERTGDQLGGDPVSVRALAVGVDRLRKCGLEHRHGPRERLEGDAQGRSRGAPTAGAGDPALSLPRRRIDPPGAADLQPGSRARLLLLGADERRLLPARVGGSRRPPHCREPGTGTAPVDAPPGRRAGNGDLGRRRCARVRRGPPRPRRS